MWDRRKTLTSVFSNLGHVALIFKKDNTQGEEILGWRLQRKISLALRQSLRHLGCRAYHFLLIMGYPRTNRETIISLYYSSPAYIHTIFRRFPSCWHLHIILSNLSFLQRMRIGYFFLPLHIFPALLYATTTTSSPLGVYVCVTSHITITSIFSIKSVSSQQ